MKESNDDLIKYKLEEINFNLEFSENFAHIKSKKISNFQLQSKYCGIK